MRFCSYIGFVWEFGASFQFLVLARPSQPIRTRIDDFQSAFNA
jgi:hypothetical protein